MVFYFEICVFFAVIILHLMQLITICCKFMVSQYIAANEYFNVFDNILF